MRDGEMERVNEGNFCRGFFVSGLHYCGESNVCNAVRHKKDGWKEKKLKGQRRQVG